MDDVPVLRPCPFCGSAEVAVVGSLVRCGTCSAAGPYGFSSVEAAHRWNEHIAIVSGSKDAGEDIAELPGRQCEP